MKGNFDLLLKPLCATIATGGEKPVYRVRVEGQVGEYHLHRMRS